MDEVSAVEEGEGAVDTAALEVGLGAVVVAMLGDGIAVVSPAARALPPTGAKEAGWGGGGARVARRKGGRRAVSCGRPTARALTVSSGWRREVCEALRARGREGGDGEAAL